MKIDKIRKNLILEDVIKYIDNNIEYIKEFINYDNKNKNILSYLVNNKKKIEFKQNGTIKFNYLITYYNKRYSNIGYRYKEFLIIKTTGKYKIYLNKDNIIEYFTYIF